MTKPLTNTERQRRFRARQQREMSIYREVRDGIKAGNFKMDVYEALAEKYHVRTTTIYETYRRVQLRLEGSKTAQSTTTSAN